MKNVHIRVLIILAILSLIGIVGTQVFWLNRAIQQQDQVFSYNVQVALRNVVESLCEANGKDFPTVNPVEQVSGNYFIVRSNDKIDLTNLEYLISAEIKKRSISQEFEYGVYDCANDQMVYAENVNLNGKKTEDKIPILKNDEYYFGVYFPEKSKSLMAGFDLWKFTTVITFVVILFFGFALFVILRQKRLSEVQRDFINNVSHELKTPLATLSLASTTLLNRTTEKENRYIQIISKEVARLQKNVEDILHSSLMESNTPVEKESIDLKIFLTDLMSDVQEEYVNESIVWELTTKIQTSICTSRKLLENSLRNLIDNAVKYGGEIIHIEAYQNVKKTEISVIDNGLGIPKEHHKNVFKKFFRVPESSNQHNQKGFGLGLHIIVSEMKKIGGRISLESTEGKGSAFKITIPNG